MKGRSRLVPWVIVTCALATVAGILCLNALHYSPCLGAEWREARLLTPTKGWHVYQRWCRDPRDPRVQGWVRSVFKVTHDGWQRIFESSVMDEFRGFWATRQHLYGDLLVYGRGDIHSAGPVVVFRVGNERGLEACAEMGDVFDSARGVRLLDAGEKNGTEWAEWAVQSERGEGRLRTEFDRCVDASRLLSPGWRLRGWLRAHRIGSGEPIERLLQEIPRVTFSEVRELAPAQPAPIPSGSNESQ
jgi:hypothetical protein